MTNALEKLFDAHWMKGVFAVSLTVTGYATLYGSGSGPNLTSDHNGLLAEHPDKVVIAIFASMFIGILVNAWMLHHTFKGNDEHLARVEASWLGKLLTPFLVLGFLTQMFVAFVILKLVICTAGYIGLLVVLPIYGGYRLLRWAVTP